MYHAIIRNASLSPTKCYCWTAAALTSDTLRHHVGDDGFNLRWDKQNWDRRNRFWELPMSPLSIQQVRTPEGPEMTLLSAAKFIKNNSCASDLHQILLLNDDIFNTRDPELASSEWQLIWEDMSFLICPKAYNIQRVMWCDPCPLPGDFCIM